MSTFVAGHLDPNQPGFTPHYTGKFQSLTGAFSDLTEPISVTMKNFLHDNWPNTSDIIASRIKFANKWWDGFGSMQIHVRDLDVPSVSIDTSGKYLNTSDFLTIHIFVRKNSQTQPPELDDMKRSITAIIELNRSKLPISTPTSSWMSVVRTDDIMENDPMQTVWHSVISVECRFFQGSTV